jgi:hypothetical protein
MSQKKWTWGEDSFASREEAERGIAQLIVDHFDNCNLSYVSGADGRDYVINVSVQLDKLALTKRRSVRDNTVEVMRLQNASRDLLHALEALIVWAEYLGGFQAPQWKQARAAIAKAKGDH